MHVLLILLSLLPGSAPTPSQGDAAGEEVNRTTVQAPSEERAVWVLSEDALSEVGADAREVLHRVPGLSVRALGDTFSLATMQIRGVGSEHTRAFLDGVPLDRADGAPVDLSLLPLWHSGSVRVWPAHAPLGFGGGLGGALVVDSRAPEAGAYELKVGAGAFERWALDAFGQGAGETTEAALGLRMESSEGDFPWVDDGRTAYDTSDDRLRYRENNDARRMTGLLRIQQRLGKCTAGALGHALDLVQGVPGPAGRLADRARYELASGLGALTLGCSGERWRASLQTSLGWMRSVALDELAEVSLRPTEAQREALSPSVRALGWLRVGSRLDLGFHQEVRRQGFRLSDRAEANPAASSSRVGTGTALGLRWRAPWAGLVLLPQVRLDTMLDNGDARRIAPAAQVVARSLMWREEGVSLEFGFSTATRFPTLYELQGDGLYISAADGLRDEHGSVLSGTIRWEAQWLPSAWRLFLVASGFATELEQMIQMRRNSLYTAVAENVGGATIWGGEVGLNADLFRHLRVELALSGLESAMESDEVAMDGNALPLRPRTLAYGRVTGYSRIAGPAEGAVFADVNHRGAYAYDMAGLARAPDLVEWGGGARLHLNTGGLLGTVGRLSLEGRLLNGGDAPGVDLLGYPRPGRRWAVQIAWREDGL